MHHTRRKSGHAQMPTPLTDVRKTVAVSDLSRPKRPQMMRRSTSQVAQKLGKNPRDREKEWQEEQWYEDDRESFPQYCMTCEKQFIPQDASYLYCSDVCRQRDQAPVATTSSYTPSKSHSSNVPFYSAGNSAGNPEPRDIIPRASPSRPSSTYLSPPTTPTSAQYTSAVSALRSLTIQPPSPPSPPSTGVWPFTRSAAVSPSSSYTKPTAFFSTTYDNGYITSGNGYGYTAGGGLASERPLPMRKSSVFGRPKSIELVTPMISR